MSINSVRKSITINQPQEDWLEEHPEVNLSQIAQVGIDRQKELFESSLQFKENKALRARIELLAKVISNQSKFIQKMELSDLYLGYVEEVERGKI